MAFERNADNRGYVQEIRIPWTLLYKNPAPRPGLKFRFTGEHFWGGPSGTTWPAVMWSDPINQENPVRIVIYQNPGVGGEMELLAKGSLPPAETEEFEERLQGPIPVHMEVRLEATRFSLVIDDGPGRRVRNLASHANVSDYLVKGTEGKRVIGVPWDGRADGLWDKERTLFLGDVVSPGRRSLYQYVAEEPAIALTSRQQKTQCFVSASIPWSVLGITPKPGLKLRGDVGVLFSDDTGAVTAQRVHWVDKQTSVVSDGLTEAEFSPARWGTLILR
jgi:hypothetical protein